jgi:hypothetical protein
MPESSAAFVLLRHKTANEVHWDLGLEQGDTLATWRILQDPTNRARINPDESLLPIPAERIGNHRKAYLEYEGPLSGDRGHVTRIDRGHWEALKLTTDTWEFRLTGAMLTGRYRLKAVPDSPEKWLFERVTQ